MRSQMRLGINKRWSQIRSFLMRFLRRIVEILDEKELPKLDSQNRNHKEKTLIFRREQFHPELRT